MSYKYTREIQLKYKLKRVKNSLQTNKPKPIDEGAKQVYELFKDLEDETKEKLIVIVLDMEHRILAFEVVAMGSSEAIFIKPVELFRPTINLNSEKFILVHNHPDGSIKPSKDDNRMTAKVKKLSGDLGITFVDHIIVGGDGYFSYKEEGRL